MSERVKVGTDLQFIRHLKKHGGETMKKCFQCATCSVVCSLSPKENAFPRKEMIQAAWGQKEELISDPDVWLCHGCGDCSTQCPRGARPADLMSAIRSYIYQKYAVPGFFGKMLNDPKYLPVVFLIPVLVILCMVLATNVIVHGGDMNLFAVRDGVLKYEDFVHKLVIEAVFIPGNLLIFFLAYKGFKNYWDDMSSHHPESRPVMSFWAAAWGVLWDFLGHKKFDKCGDNSNRYFGHIYVFYGFMATMIATGLVVVGEMYHYGGIIDGMGWLQSISFHLPYPMGIMHPVKLLGMAGGLFLMIGLLLFTIKRLRENAHDGKSTYNDWLFLWIILGVATTGMLTVITRFSEIAALGYMTYFIHLVLVFSLLWYMPYSKFAHMLYRFFGLTYLKMHGRDHKPEKF